MANSGPEAEELKKILNGDLEGISLETMNFYVALMEKVQLKLQERMQARESLAPKQIKLPPPPPPMPSLSIPPKMPKSTITPDGERSEPNHHEVMQGKMQEIEGQLKLDTSKTFSPMRESRLMAIAKIEADKAAYIKQRAAERANPDAFFQVQDQVLAVVQAHKRSLRVVPPKPSKSREELQKEKEEIEKLEALLKIEDIVATFELMNIQEEIYVNIDMTPSASATTTRARSPS